MRRNAIWGGVLLLALAASLVACNRSPEAGSGATAIAWERDLPSALARAGSEKKLVMVDFYTDWCRWCRVLDDTTFADDGVQQALRQGIVSVRLNAETDGRAAATRFDVDGFPTILFLNAQGAEVARIPGYLPPAPFLAELNNIIKKG